MSQLKNEFVKIILPALFMYAAVIMYQGYSYGKGDQSQILPVMFAQDHPGSYLNDHYIQSYLEAGINERTIFQFLLRWLGYDSPLLVLFWHALASIALFAAWISIAANFIKSQHLQWAAIVMIFILGYHTSAGSNELYYPEFIPSLPAKALASWGLFFWIKNKFSLWSPLLIASTFLQPLVGLQLFLITFLGLVAEGIRSKDGRRMPLKAVFLYLLFTTPWIIVLAINNGGHTNPSLFFEIIEFRLSHHFFASHFGLIHLIILLLLSVTVWAFYKSRIRWMVVFIWAGLIIYEVGVEIFEIPFFLNAQWWKTTIWLEGLASIAIGAVLEKTIFRRQSLKKGLPFLPFLIVFLIIIYRFFGIGSTPDFMAPFPGKVTDDVDISLKAGESTPPEATFLIPAELSAFRWYSKRSTYVDYKAMLHQEKFLFEWYERIQEVYAYTDHGHDKPQHLNLTDPGNDKINKWKQFGITHVIARSGSIKNLQPVASNATYTIYSLR